MNDPVENSAVEKQILGELLDRYERSKVFRERSLDSGSVPSGKTRRILLRIDADEKLSALMEDTDKRKEFLRAAENLRLKGVIDYSWARYEKGNLIDRIWLLTEEESLRKSYRITGRIGKHALLDLLERQICSVLEIGLAPQTEEGAEQGDPAEPEMDAKSGVRTEPEMDAMSGVRAESDENTEDIRCFLTEMLHTIRETRSVPRFFFKGDKDKRSEEAAARKNENLLRFLSVLMSSREEVLERVISTRLYGDSKYFERELRSRVLSILRHIAECSDRTKAADTESGNWLLEERGVMKWPEILEFCGGIRIWLDDGKEIDCSSQIYGAYVNSETVRHIRHVELINVKRVLTIENKANYTWYLGNAREEAELVLYHGGCFSPVKGRWMKKIREAADRSGREIVFHHWSDIDAGGFRIFLRLRREIFPGIMPVHMDVETLQQNTDRCIPIEDERYIGLLRMIRENPEYGVFSEVLDYMLEQRVRLEQEAEI